MKKSKTTALLLLLFYIGKLIFCQKTYLKKLSLYCYIRIAVFSRGRLLDWRCSNTNANIDIHWFCNRHTSLQNTWQYARCFNADFNSNGLFFLFIYFRQVLSIQEKKYINLGNQFHCKNYNERDRNISKPFDFIFHQSIQHEASGYTFYKEKKAFAREYFWFTLYK